MVVAMNESNVLCPFCGEGVLVAIGRGTWGECTECRRASNFADIERHRDELAAKEQTREAEACFYEDQHRYLPEKRSSSSGPCRRSSTFGVAYTESTAGTCDVPPWATEESDAIMKVTVINDGRKLPLSCRYSAALISRFELLGLSNEKRVEAVKAALEEEQ